MRLYISFAVETPQGLGGDRSRGRAERGRNPLSFTTLFAKLTLLLGLAVCGPIARAQSGAGSIQGTVTDSSGAMIPGATIHVVNPATGVVTDSTSNNVGFYLVPELFTGTYVVTIKAPGMSTVSQTLDLLVGQNAVINVSLPAGAVTQQITVNANVVQLVTTDNGTLSSTLENARINELPMNGRNILALVEETTPGMETCNQSSTTPADCENGQQGVASDLEIDGVSAANRDFGSFGAGNLQTQVADPDAIQEVQVQTTNSGAQFALPTTELFTTKSGTNQLHGSLFETARNNAFGIARSRNDLSNYAAPELIRNEFGGSVGGPIVIPHLYRGKDKSFFFFAYERYSEPEGNDEQLAVPTQAMLGGDFSGLVNSSGVLQELYDPDTTASSSKCAEPASAGTATASNKWCRTPFGGNPATGSTYNYIPSGRESPLTAILNKLYPLPTNSENPLVGDNWVDTIPTIAIEPQYTLRLDHVFDEKNRAYLRYGQQNYSHVGAQSSTAYGDSLPISASNFTLPANSTNSAQVTERFYLPSLGFTHIFSPTFVSETILAAQQYKRTDGGLAPAFDYEAAMGVPNSFGETGFPEFEDIFEPSVGSQFAYTATQKILNADENLTKTMGKHQLLFGGRYRLEEFGFLEAENEDTIQFDGEGTELENPSTPATSPTAYSNTGQINADWYLGAADDYTVNLEPPYIHLRDMEIDAYLQDNYRIARNLTLNLGARYEAHPAAWVGNGEMMGFDLKNDAYVTSAPISQLIAKGLTTQAIVNNDEADGMVFETPAEANLPPMLTKNYNFIWEPRFGAAWQPFGKWGTVLRGGFGKYIFPNPLYEDYNNMWKDNPFTVTYSQSYTSAAYAPDGIENYLLRAPQTTSSSYTYSSTGTPVMGVNTTGNIVNTTTTTAIKPGISFRTLNEDFAPSGVEEADFAIEQPMKWNSALRIAYVYTRGVNLHQFWYFNDWASEFTWEVQQGAPLPTSSTYGPTYSATGRGPYDQRTYSDDVTMDTKDGWSNYNGLQASYQKLYHSGIAWQAMYVWSKSMRSGGIATNTATEEVNPYSSYNNAYVGSYVGAGANTVTYAPELGTLGEGGIISAGQPPPPPTGTPVWGHYKALERWENYSVDIYNPPQHFQFNALVDLPFGRGKRWLAGVNKGVNELVGGWQLASAGSITKTDFAVTASNWGPTRSPGAAGNSLTVYKKHAPITDCRSGVCLKSYEWFNGYLAPTVVSGNTCAAQSGTAVVSGLPSGWQPYQTPIDVGCTATTVDKYYGDNDVIMNGVTGQAANSAIPYATDPANDYGGIAATTAVYPANPFGHTVLNGPANFEADASLFKLFSITERVNFRMTVDAFNVFNIQGLPNPSGATGTVCYTPGGLGCSSYNTPRQLQFGARLTF